MMYDAFKERYRFNIKDPDAEIGRGGFGKVYKAYDTVHHKWVAIKIAAVQTDREQLSLRSEIERAKLLPDHPNIARYEQCFRFDLPSGTYDYGIMQYYERGNLSQLIRGGQIATAQKERIALGMLTGIAFLHRHQMLHRDLKSSNVLIAAYGDELTPLITDFGLSKHIQSEEAEFSNSLIGGSLLYASPEQLLGEPLRYNADLWAFGVMLYELFCGQMPFMPDDSAGSISGIKMYNAILQHEHPALLGTMPQPWQGICRRCLVFDNALRVPDADALLKELAGGQASDDTVLMDKTAPQARAVGRTTKEPRVRQSAPAPAGSSKIGLWAGFLVMVIVGSLGAYALIPNMESDPVAITPPEPMQNNPAPPQLPSAREEKPDVEQQFRSILSALAQQPEDQRLAFLMSGSLPSLLADEVTYYYDFEGSKGSGSAFISFLSRKTGILNLKMIKTDAGGKVVLVELETPSN